MINRKTCRRCRAALDEDREDEGRGFCGDCEDDLDIESAAEEARQAILDLYSDPWGDDR